MCDTRALFGSTGQRSHWKTISIVEKPWKGESRRIGGVSVTGMARSTAVAAVTEVSKIGNHTVTASVHKSEVWLLNFLRSPLIIVIIPIDYRYFPFPVINLPFWSVVKTINIIMILQFVCCSAHNFGRWNTLKNPALADGYTPHFGGGFHAQNNFAGRPKSIQVVLLIDPFLAYIAYIQRFLLETQLKS